MGRRWSRLPAGKRREIIGLAVRGWSYRAIAAELRVAQGSVGRVLRPLGGVVRRDMLEVPAGRLSLEDRFGIKAGLDAGGTFEAIGVRLGFHRSTICREVNANRGRGGYRPMTAHRLAFERAKRPKATKLASNPVLLARVVDGLEQLWSPQQVCRRLRAEFGDDPSMSISHETIYQSLYVQGRGELRRELAACLRTGRTVRRHHADPPAPRGRITGMINIADRAAEVADRAVPGHWEGDLIIGKNGKSAIGTLVERSTRFVMLLHLPNGRTADEVRTAMTAAITQLPDTLRRSVTWDQGIEMAGHAKFTIDTGIDVYFCDPHSPWQRGSNENTNGLLRQYFPKSTDLSVHSLADLQAAADSLNGRPRQTLSWMKPSEKLNELLVATTT